MLSGKSYVAGGKLTKCRRLVAEGFEVDVFERRSQAGGLWNFSPAANAPFASAVYADLRTNFPRQLMELQDYPWTTQPLFMQHDLVREYLEGYAQEIQHESYGLLRINFNTQVVRLLYERCAGGYWELTCKSVITGQSATRRYPYVVVAVGVFDEPLIPSYEGLSEWKKIRENSLSHAKEYRDPKTFKGKVRPTLLSFGSKRVIFGKSTEKAFLECSNHRLSSIWL